MKKRQRIRQRPHRLLVGQSVTTSTFRIAGVAVDRTKVAGAAELERARACGARRRTRLPDDVHAVSAQASRSGGKRMPQYTLQEEMGSRVGCPS